MVQLPLPSAVAVPTLVAPANRSTVLPASAVPVKVGVVTLVILSVLELPLSLAAVISGVEGAAGAALSSVKVSAVPVKVLPALSVAVAWTVYVPSLCDAHDGRVPAALVHVVDVLLVVALFVAARWNTLDCQLDVVEFQ